MPINGCLDENIRSTAESHQVEPIQLLLKSQPEIVMTGSKLVESLH